MKNDHPLDRLLRAAAKAPANPTQSEAMPAAMEQRILAHWRSASAQASPDFADLLRLFRSGLAFATVIAAATVFLSWKSPVHEETDELAIAEANYELALR